jgi:hypothetical protein
LSASSRNPTRTGAPAGDRRSTAALLGPAPTIDVVMGYAKTNTSPVLKLFLARLSAQTASASS